MHQCDFQNHLIIKHESAIYINHVKAGDLFYRDCFLNVSSGPCSSSEISSLSLSELCRDWKKPHPASSALNQNNYPEKCSAEPARGEGNEAQRLLAITSLQSLLVISLLLWEEDPGGLGGGHVQPTGRRTDGQRKGLMWLHCPESISVLWRLWQHYSSSGDWHPSAHEY